MTRVEEAKGAKEVIDKYVEGVLSIIKQQGEKNFQDEIFFFPQEPHPILGRRYHSVAGPLFLEMFGESSLATSKA